MLNQLNFTRQSFSLFGSGNIFITDVLDVIFVATLVYCLFILLKQTRAYIILFGIFLLASVFAVSKVLNLYLTQLALTAVFNVLIIILIVIFQKEIRRFFELLALLGTRQIKTDSGKATQPVGVISQACAQLSRERIGALLVFPGKDLLDPYIDGGEDCDAIVSDDLLLSIFDPHSAGHDGAVILKAGRLVKFGTHLPLSTNFRELGKHGTRHSAALGIAERTDALAIVVSEERGTISVCRDGKLRKLDSYDDLQPLLNKFLKEKFGAQVTSIWQTFIQKNFRLKLMALICAMLLWGVFAYRAEIITKEITIPITFEKLTENTLVEDFSPKEIRVSFAGRGAETLNNLSPSTVSVSLSTAGLKDGLNTLEIRPEQIKRPLNTDLVSFAPATVYLSVKKYQLNQIPVKVNTEGTPARFFTVGNISVSPDTIDVWVPDNASPPQFIPTKPISLAGVKENVVQETSLILPTGIKLKSPDALQVSVAISIVPQ